VRLLSSSNGVTQASYYLRPEGCCARHRMASVGARPPGIFESTALPRKGRVARTHMPVEGVEGGACGLIAVQPGHTRRDAIDVFSGAAVDLDVFAVRPRPACADISDGT